MAPLLDMFSGVFSHSLASIRGVMLSLKATRF
jgi:hypothetical protein